MCPEARIGLRFAIKTHSLYYFSEKTMQRLRMAQSDDRASRDFPPDISFETH